MVLSDDRGEVVMGLCLPDRLTVVTVSEFPEVWLGRSRVGRGARVHLASINKESVYELHAANILHPKP